MARAAALRRAVLAVAAIGAADGRLRRGRSQLRAARRCRSPPQYRFVEGTGAGAVAGRLALVAGVRRSGAADAGAGGAGQQPRPAAGASRASRKRAPAPASRSRSSTRRSTPAPATACAQASSTAAQDGTPTNDDTTHQSGAYGFQLSWEIDLFGRLRRQHEAALALLLASEQAPPRRAGHAGRRRRDQLLPAARARSAARDRAADAAPQRRDGDLLPEPAGRRRVESPRARSDPGQSGRRPRRRFPNIEQQIAIVENALSLLLGRPPGADRARARWPTPSAAAARFRPACRRRCSSGGPTWCRRSRCWSRPTPTSAPPRRCSFRRSA